jgi:hypothetical protein
MKLLLIAIGIFLLVMILFVGLMISIANNQIDFPLFVIYLISFGVPILIIFFTVLAIKDTYKSFRKNKNKISFKSWLFNLIPFRPIDSLIKQVYPNEQVISKIICFDGIVNLVKTGKTPINFGYALNMVFPAFLIETDKGFYIDRRLQEVLKSIALPVIGYGIALFVFHGSDHEQTLVKIFLYPIIFGTTILFLMALFWQVSRVDVIKKSWLSNIEKTKYKIILSGVIPTGAPLSLSTDKFVNTGSISLPFKQIFFTF